MPIDQSYRLIPLTRGQFAIVDEADHEWLSQIKWRANWNPFVRGYYAKRDAKKGEPVLMHRVIMGLVNGDGQTVDHRNRNTLDNRRSNLRIATYSQNSSNRGMTRKNTSGYKGVSKCGDRWKAQFKFNGEHFYLGLFQLREEAYAAYCEAVKHVAGEFSHCD